MNESIQRRRYVETRQEIVRAAYTIICANGVDGLSMRAIARAVHMSPANLYEYFANKDEIVHSVFAKTVAALEAQVRQIDKSLPAEEYLIAICLGYLDFAYKEQEQMLVLCDTVQATTRTRLAVNGNGAATKPLTANTKGLFELFLTGVERYLNLKSITPSVNFDAEDIAYTLLSLVYGFVAITSHELRPLSPTAMRLAIQTFLNGLTTTSPISTIKESLQSVAIRY